ncbi:VOC family protein [Skermania piniformis]|uniref:VOC family protein n=1 Tax=Skermania pinensis TaxID=39122 RepID=A0ABX8S3G5_9ACTN|nr:VOC family protein [Skermania piniformis]QXQ12368.1 VOC family protein [Skermania piniformis]
MPVRHEVWPAGTPNWVDLSAADPAKAAEFYASLFGWTNEASGVEFGDYIMNFKDGEAVAGIGPKPVPEMPANWSTYLASDDADATATAIQAAGGTLQMDPFDVGEFGRMFFAVAPDGASFGIWQAKQHTGATRYNEDGALAWNELHSNDLDAARAFYTAVFGYEYDDLTNPEFTYFVAKRAGETAGIGGMCGNEMAPPGTPSHWLTWFAAADCDAATARAVELGANQLMPPTDSPFGRMSIVAGLEGEMFGLIDVATTVGEMPDAAGS